MKSDTTYDCNITLRDAVQSLRDAVAAQRLHLLFVYEQVLALLAAHERQDSVKNDKFERTLVA